MLTPNYSTASPAAAVPTAKHVVEELRALAPRIVRSAVVPASRQTIRAAPVVGTLAQADTAATESVGAL
jgi:hypothetical protein